LKSPEILRAARYLATPHALPVVAALSLALSLPALAQDRASRRPARPDVTLPEGPVRQIILSNCSACHGIDEYDYYAMDRDSWAALIDRMRTAKSGQVEGTNLSAQDEQILLDWLVAEFGPDADPFVREYVVREVTDETRLSDAEARVLVDRACAGCHSPVADVIAARLDEDRWRETLSMKIATGARLLIDEVDPLIDWLTAPESR
jgi:mono/diheme cytochrome c family protein